MPRLIRLDDPSTSLRCSPFFPLKIATKLIDLAPILSTERDFFFWICRTIETPVLYTRR